MIKWYQKVGNYIFDYLVLGLLLFLSTILIMPFYSTYVGLIAYFKEDTTYKTIFKTIKRNIKNLIYFTLILLVLVLLLYLTVVIDNSDLKNGFNIIVRYFILAIIIMMLIYPPIIIIKMEVNVKETIKNTLYLSLMFFKETLFLFGLTVLFIWLLTVNIFVLILFIPYIQTISYITNKNISVLKENRGDL